MKYNPNIHHRMSIRLKGYDYSQAGLYFITICTQDKIYRFGNIENNQIFLNENGNIAYNEWVKLSERYVHVKLDVFQIMPNHLYGIISLNDLVGTGFTPVPTNDVQPQSGQPQRVVPTVGNIIGAYKSLVANGCLEIYKSKNEIMGKFWQRNYYEHIIRDEKSYLNISNYIKNNPAKWQEDKFNSK